MLCVTYHLILQTLRYCPAIVFPLTSNRSCFFRSQKLKKPCKLCSTCWILSFSNHVCFGKYVSQKWHWGLRSPCRLPWKQNQAGSLWMLFCKGQCKAQITYLLSRKIGEDRINALAVALLSVHYSLARALSDLCCVFKFPFRSFLNNPLEGFILAENISWRQMSYQRIKECHTYRDKHLLLLHLKEVVFPILHTLG